MIARGNQQAEESVIGAALLDRHSVARLVVDLAPADFTLPAHVAVWAAIVGLHEAGAPIDSVTVADALAKRGSDVSAAQLISYTVNVPAISHAPAYARLVRREASARRCWGACLEAIADLEKGADPSGVSETLEVALAKLDRAGHLPDRYWRSFNDYLAAPVTQEAALVESLIGRRGRLLVLAIEKSGKSYLLRQVAFMLAAGIHPFSLDVIEPIRVLILDAENDDDELQPSGHTLGELVHARLFATTGSDDYPRPALFSAPSGMDLRGRRDRAALEEVLEDCKAELIIGGPIYKLADRREREGEDDFAAGLQRVCDDVRRRYGCAWILEHHAPTGQDGKERQLRSKGGQRWDAWCNATIALHKRDDGATMQVRYPHPPRGQISWPGSFVRGIPERGEWPWEPRVSKRKTSSVPRLSHEAPGDYQQEGIF